MEWARALISFLMSEHKFSGDIKQMYKQRHPFYTDVSVWALCFMGAVSICSDRKQRALFAFDDSLYFLFKQQGYIRAFLMTVFLRKSYFLLYSR